jgi:hypothetical protein
MMEERRIVGASTRRRPPVEPSNATLPGTGWRINHEVGVRRPDPPAGAMPRPVRGRVRARFSWPPIKAADVVSRVGGTLRAEDARTLFCNSKTRSGSGSRGFNNTDVEAGLVTLDGVTYRDVGVHFRACHLLMVPEGSKRSLNLSIDYVHDSQRLLGYRTHNLLNANGDPRFATGVVRKYQAQYRRRAPTTSGRHQRRDSVYVNTQQFNADFTREWFAIPGCAVEGPRPRCGAGRHVLGGRRRLQSRLRIKSKEDPPHGDRDSDVPGVERAAPEKLEAALTPCST